MGLTYLYGVALAGDHRRARRRWPPRSRCCPHCSASPAAGSTGCGSLAPAARRRADADATPAARWSRARPAPAVDRRDRRRAVVLLVLADARRSACGSASRTPATTAPTTTTRQAFDLITEALRPGRQRAARARGRAPRGRRRGELRALLEPLRTSPAIASVAPPTRQRRGRHRRADRRRPTTSPQDDGDRGPDRPAARRRPAGPATARQRRRHARAALVDQARRHRRPPAAVHRRRRRASRCCSCWSRSARSPSRSRPPCINLFSIAAAYGVVALLAQGGWAGQLVGIDTPTPDAAVHPGDHVRDRCSGSRWTTRSSCSRASARPG